MLRIVSFFWQLCLLRASPASLPGTHTALGLILVFYGVFALIDVILTQPRHSVVAAIGIVVVGTLIQGLLTYSLLTFKQLASRFYATWGALLGTNAIMVLILLPFHLANMNVENDQLRQFADSALWVCFGWWLAIGGYIFHKAINISILQGAAIVFVIKLLSLIVTGTLFPPTT